MTTCLICTEIQNGHLGLEFKASAINFHIPGLFQFVSCLSPSLCPLVSCQTSTPEKREEKEILIWFYIGEENWNVKSATHIFADQFSLHQPIN